MVAPLSARIIARHGINVEDSPLDMTIVLPQEDGVTAAFNELVDLTTDDLATANLGSSGFGRAVYDYIEDHANVHVSLLPFEVDGTDNAAGRAARVVGALDALNSPVELAKIGGPPDIIILPDECSRGGTVSNPVVATLKSICATRGCTAFVDSAQDSQANAALWAGNNVNLNIFAFTNKGDVRGQSAMWGSVIGAGMWGHYTGIHGIHAQPANLRDHVLGVSNISPERLFSEGDGSAPAEALSDEGLTSIITWDGGHYLWGGRTGTVGTDPRVYVSNNIVSQRMVKQARRLLAPFLGLRGTGRRLSSMALAVENSLVAQYVPGAIEDLEVAQPVLTGGRASVALEAKFYQFIESIQLTAEVYS